MKRELFFIKRLILLLITFLMVSFIEKEEEDNSGVTVFEKVYLHLDRHFYLSGDDVWFKAYLVDAQTGKPAQNGSKILYAELISPESKLLMRRVLFVDSVGCSIGDFRLKDKATSGKYRIRAYTKLMLNFGDVFVFEKEIEVQNGSDEPESGAKNKRADKTGNPNETVIAREDVDIEFFPESGSLILGIENTVAFKANDWSGKGAEVSGGVLNSNGDTVALFASEYLGMGKFVFTPQTGESYRAFFVPKDIAYSLYAEFPETSDKGFTMNIIDTDTVFILNIRTNTETFTEFAGKNIYLTFKQSEKSTDGYEIPLNKKSEPVLIPKSMLPAGITRITLYDEQEKPHCERLVYVENMEKVNVSITPADDTTSIIKVTDDNGLPVEAYLSMSVTNGVIPDETSDIESYFWLESEIKGKIERPSAYFDVANADRFRQIDLLLLTQGWRDFVWKHVEKNISEFAGYEPERGLKITGRVKKLIGNKPYPDATITLYFPDPDTDISEDIPDFLQKKGRRYTTKTDSSGNYGFGYTNFFGYRTISLTSKTKKGKEAGEISINPLSMPAEEFPVKIWKQYQIDSAYRFVAENYKKDYKLTDTILLDPVTVSNRKDGHLISDREITPGDVSTWMSLGYYTGGISPCLIIPCKSGYIANYNYFDMDGKRISDSIHPSKISLEEIDRVVIYRKSDFEGLYRTKNIYTIDVYAKNGKFSKMNYAEKNAVANGGKSGSSFGFHFGNADNPELNSIKPVVTGYYEARKFYKPKFEMTDINNYYGTYFWQSDIRTDANGESVINYNPEKQPSGKIRIEGITDGGIPTRRVVMVE